MKNSALAVTLLFCALSTLSLYSCKQKDPNQVTGLYRVAQSIYDSAVTTNLDKKFSEGSSGSGEEVPPKVVSVGHNEEFIIVKQHPTTGHPLYIPDTTVINYYIIDINSKYRDSLENVIGPLPKEKFDSLRLTYKIEDIQFDMNYPVSEDLKILNYFMEQRKSS